jgi:hypothetical protein
MSEKQADYVLLTPYAAPKKPSFKRRFMRLFGLVAGCCLLALVADGVSTRWTQALKGQDVFTCDQPEPLLPSKNKKTWSSLHETISTDKFKTRLIDWLSGAVQIPYVLVAELSGHS